VAVQEVDNLLGSATMLKDRHGTDRPWRMCGRNSTRASSLDFEARIIEMVEAESVKLVGR